MSATGPTFSEGAGGAGRPTGLPPSGTAGAPARTLIVTAAAFLVPTVLLGMIAPVLARLVMRDLGEVGRAVGSLNAYREKRAARTSLPVRKEDLEATLKNGRGVVLSDDYAPVDNLIAPVFEERFGLDRR